MKRSALSQLGIILPAFATALGILVLSFTETYRPPGSSWAPVVLLILVAAHLPLLRRIDTDRASASAGMSPLWPGIAAAAFIVISSAVFISHGTRGIFERGVSPFADAQLGLMTQVSARLPGGVPLYAVEYPRDGYTESNPFPAGAAIPYALANAYGLDWRFASLAALSLAGALLASGALWLSLAVRKRDDLQAVLAPAAIYAAGACWLILPTVIPYIHWGHTITLWPLIVLLGLTLIMEMPLMTALVAGLLAAMNPGWLLLLPLIGAHLWRENQRGFPWVLAAMLFWPLVAYGAFRAELPAMLQGILGRVFHEGNDIDPGQAWRFASLQGIGEILNLRHAIYTVAILGLAVLVREIAREGDRPRRIALIAFGGFLLIVCAPMTFSFHWMGHAMLLAGLIPAHVYTQSRTEVLLDARTNTRAPRIAVVVAATAIMALVALIAGTISLVSFPGPRPNEVFAQRATENLLTGFHDPSVDHVWGSAKDMAVGFPVKKPCDGALEIELGTLAGDFTPFNPVEIRLNGRVIGLYRVLPGDFRKARIPLTAGDLQVGFNIVEFRAAWTRSAHSLNIGDDLRPMSICYRGLRYIPVDERVAAVTSAP